jgi:hypothetical protein
MAFLWVRKYFAGIVPAKTIACGSWDVFNLKYHPARLIWLLRMHVTVLAWLQAQQYGNFFLSA